MDTTVALNKLLLSPRNVRKTYVDEDLDSLADSIEQKGLLQNLVVSESIAGKGIYEVDAGGRRWRALDLLAKRKAIPRNWPVPVKIVPRDDAAEASLAENLQKIALNPADEFLAFETIIAGYEAGGIASLDERIQNCARRFGVTVRHVEQRLRLAALAPQVLDALREDRITLDAAKAYATYPDHKLQLNIFNAEEKKGELWRHAAKSVRDALTGKVYHLDHPAVVYAGLDAYLAAGGRVERELFMGAEDRDVLVDPAIVDKLCEKRTAEDATEFAREDGWQGGVVKPWVGPSWNDARPPKGFKKSYALRPADATEEQKAVSVLAFAIAADGSTLEALDYCFVPEGESAASSATYVAETPEQAAARERRAAVELKALHLAAPAIAGTPLEGRTFWPPRHTRWVDAVSQESDGTYIVALLVRIPAADYEQSIEEAERRYDLEQAELAEEEAAIAAEAKDGLATDVAEPEPAQEAVS